MPGGNDRPEGGKAGVDGQNGVDLDHIETLPENISLEIKV